MFRKSEKLEPFQFERTEEDNRNYSNPDNDPRGLWRSGDVRSPNYRETLRFYITTPSGKKIPPPDNGWRWSEKSIQDKISTGEIIFADNESRIVRKIYLSEQKGRTPENLWLAAFAGTTRQANAEIKIIFGCVPFDTPKPVSLAQKILSLGTDATKEDIVLDFFAGSGTTGHAVLAQNAKDGGNRRYILVQLPEPLNPKKKEQKTAAEFCDKLGKPRTIAELTKERLRRAAKKIKDENPLFAGDTGFRVFKLDSSNIKAWNPQPEDVEAQLEAFVDHVEKDRTEADLLYELLLKLGLDLCVPIEQKEIAGKTVHAIGGGVLMACLAEKIMAKETEPLALGIVEWHKKLAPAGDTTCVFRDSAFENDVAKANLAAILEQSGIQNVRSL